MLEVLLVNTLCRRSSKVSLREFSLQAAYKDIVNVQEAATEYEAQLPVVSAMVSKYQAAIDMGYGDEPKSSMIKVHEKQLDQKVRLTLP